MKIGILTYHRSHNYGALLQAIALRVVLEKMGNDVFYVDYWPNYHKQMYAPFSLKKMINMRWRAAIYLIRRLYHLRSIRSRVNVMNYLISIYIEPYVVSMEEYFDVVVLGSDQIWRKQPIINKYDPIYFGCHQFLAKKIITYAASTDKLCYSDEVKNFFTKAMSHFDYISVREDYLKAYIQSLGLCNVRLDIDPVLLLTKEQCSELFELRPLINRPYVVCYILGDNLFNYENLQKYFNKRGKYLVFIKGSGVTHENNVLNDIPLNSFLSYLYYSDLILTSSYHGVVLSLLFEKQFYALFKEEKIGRAKSLLELLHLSQRLVSSMDSFEIDRENIDYNRVNKIIESQRKASVSFLKKEIG